MGSVDGTLRLLPAGPQASVRIGATPGVRAATGVPDVTTDDGGDLPKDRVEVSDAARRMASRGTGALTDAQLREIQDLVARDRAVRQHEAAHMAAGGSLSGAATFTTETGPDGRQYAVAGEVPIDVAPGRTPDETIRRARQVRAAALAPADPSSQDLRVAAEAASLELSALLEAAAATRGVPKKGTEPGDEVAIATIRPRRAEKAHASGDSCAACIGAVRTWARAAASPA